MRKIVIFESEKLELLDDGAKFARLYDMGLIDSAGDSILVEIPNDNEGANKEEFMKFWWLITLHELRPEPNMLST